MRTIALSCSCLILLACNTSATTSSVPIAQEDPPATSSTTTTSSTAQTAEATTTTRVPVSTVQQYKEPSLSANSPNSCRLRDRSPDRELRYSLVTGFPVRTENFESSGVFDISLIPIDFQDFPGGDAIAERVIEQTELVSEWYRMVSGGQVEIRWRIHNEWVRVPGLSTDFALERSRSDDNNLANAAFAAADPHVDFTDIRAGIFLLPRNATFMAEGVQGFLHSQFGPNGFKSAEGTIYNYAIGGAHWDNPQRPIWTYWAHEIGHMFPLPDLYDVRGQWWIGTELEIPGGPFSGFDLMANQDGPSRTLSTWLRFVMGWLTDEQVLCLDPDSVTDGEVMLVPTDEPRPGVKTIMVPLRETRILVVESRRPHPVFDCDTARSDTPWRSRSGVIVYVADMTVGHGNGFQSLIAPSERSLNGPPDGCSVPPQLDAILTPGEFVTVDGLTITVLSGGTYDTVRISKG